MHSLYLDLFLIVNQKHIITVLVAYGYVKERFTHIKVMDEYQGFSAIITRASNGEGEPIKT